MKIVWDKVFTASMFMADVWMRVAEWADDRLSMIEAKKATPKIVAPKMVATKQWALKNAKKPMVPLVGGPLDGGSVPLKLMEDHVAVISDEDTKRCYSYHFLAKHGEYRYDREVGTLGMPKQK